MKTLRGGFTTGSCAAAAAKAAVMILSGDDPNGAVDISLPDGSIVSFDLNEVSDDGDSATAVVVKDAGDDPDVTDGALITVTASWNGDGSIRLKAGEGVGTVTLPGLQAAVGEPAINPVPKKMIEENIRSICRRGVDIVISVPGGSELATKTYNGKLGIVDGISIIGTTGRVKPFSCEAVREALRCSLSIAAGAGITHPVLVPGNIGHSSAEENFDLRPHQAVQAGNDWGYMLDAASSMDFEGILLMGHPGKLTKLAMGHWDTHSSRSPGAGEFTAGAASKLFERNIKEPNTVEGLFAELAEEEKKTLADHLSESILRAAAERIDWGRERLAVILVNMKNRILGSAGDLAPWTGE